MKKTKWLLCTIAICFIPVIYLFYKQERPESASLTQTLNVGKFADVKALQTNVKTREADVNTNKLPTPARKVPEPERSIAPEEKLRAILEGKNLSIEFWGKVVDQNDAPLSNVKIESQIRHWDIVPGVGTSGRKIEDSTVTSADGRFYFGGSTGDDLTIKMEKDGYELDPNTKLGFGYDTAEKVASKPETPVVFIMWQTNIHERLITGQKSFHIAPDGRMYVIDLAKGTISESGPGDLKLWIKRPAQVTPEQKYDWSSEIDVIDGGLLEETNTTSSMYLAPQKGYISSFKYEQQVRGRQRASTGARRFYAKLTNGREYAKIIIELIAPYNDHVPGMVHIEYAINPSGSPVLR